MADILKIKSVDGSDVVDLLTGTLALGVDWNTKIGLQRGSYKASRYSAQWTFAGIDPVDEVLGLTGRGTATALRTALNNLERIVRVIREWHTDPLNQTSYWLHWASAGETEKRALIFNATLEYPSDNGLDALLSIVTAIRVKLAITRHGLWEDVTNTDHSLTSVSCAGGKSVDATGDGTEPGRIWTAAFIGQSGGGGPLARFWCGIREPYLGTSSFNPIWEAELGSNELADVSTVVDATMSGGNKKRITFATSASLAKRSRIVLSTIESTHPEHFVGRYLVLARMQLTAGSTTVGVRIQSGFNQTASFTPNEEVYFTDTNLRLVELGEISIPPGRYPGSGFYGLDALKNFSIDIYAERISGAASLDIDCLYLVPSGHFAFGDGALVQYVAGQMWPLYLLTLEDDSVLGLAYSNGIPAVNLAPTMRDFYWPVGGGVVVLCGERATSHVLADFINISLVVIPRWKGFRAS